MKPEVEKRLINPFPFLGLIIMLLMFFQCNSREHANIPGQKSAEELLADIENIPMVEDPEPVWSEPDYGRMFDPDLSIASMQELIAAKDGEALAPSTEKLLKEIEDRLSAPDGELKATVENINVDLLSQVLDPNKPLDPGLEDFLKGMLEVEALGLAFPVFPELPQFEAATAGKKEKKALTGENLRTMGACADEVRDEFSSGFRICGLGYNDNVAEIESNYARRVAEAEARFQQRNALIQQLYDQKLVISKVLMSQAVPVIKDLMAREEFKEIKSQLKCLGLVYAYFFRNHLETVFEKGLLINELYLQHETATITALRDKSLEAADANYQECNARVEQLIQEEIERRCK